MALTKDEWKRVEEDLKSFYHSVALMCDGFHIVLRLERISVVKNAICVYVNDHMKHYSKDCEELRRFQYPSVRKAHSAKEQREIRKMPKWLRKQLGHFGNPDATYTVYQPWWGSFQALKRHLIKQNQDIELLKSSLQKPVMEGTDAQQP